MDEIRRYGTLIIRPKGCVEGMYKYRCGLVEGMQHAFCQEISAYHTVEYTYTGEKILVVVCTDREYNKFREIVATMGRHLCEFDVNLDEVC